MDIEKIINNGRVMRSITSLEPGEFEQLVFAFEKEWLKQNARKTFEGEVRQREVGAGCKGVLSQAREKVFFILMYYKLYPIQEAMAFFWGMSQGRVCDWIHRLTPVIQTVLGKELKLPERRPQKLHAMLRECPELKFIIDGTDRRVRRPQDKDQQKKNYSGKRKAHTKKNVLITSGRRVVYLSQTQPGRCHDKKIAEEIKGRHFPPGSTLLQDSGFLGFHPQGAEVWMPQKKPKGKPLAPWWKKINRAISSVRVGVEHVISGIKRCHIVSSVFRNFKKGFDDQVMEIACGLHNLRTDFRSAHA